MEAEGFSEYKNRIHAHLSHDRLKEAISALFQMLAEHPKNALEKRAIITAAALERLERAWRNQVVDWNTYAGGKDALIAEVYEIIEGVERLIALPAGDSSYEARHREVYERVKGLLRRLGEAPQTPMALLLMALGLAASEQILSSFTDPRDGRTYRTVRLAGKTWMAENLNYNVGEGCWFYDNDPKNGEKYGRLYTWEAAKRACPPGWRLPEDEEWRALAMAHGGLWYYGAVDKGDPKKAYSALIEGGSDSNRSGFAALLGGLRSTDGSFYDPDGYGDYWSATESGSGYAWYYFFSRDDGKLNRNHHNKGFGFSCRCVQGAPSNGID